MMAAGEPASRGGARPVAPVSASAPAASPAPAPRPRRVEPAVSPEFARPENEDDDGYDPWSDRRPTPEPLFEPDPWD